MWTWEPDAVVPLDTRELTGYNRLILCVAFKSHGLDLVHEDFFSLVTLNHSKMEKIWGWQIESGSPGISKTGEISTDGLQVIRKYNA